jgi:hypothetical protein
MEPLLKNHEALCQALCLVSVTEKSWSPLPSLCLISVCLLRNHKALCHACSCLVLLRNHEAPSPLGGSLLVPKRLPLRNLLYFQYHRSCPRRFWCFVLEDFGVYIEKIVLLISTSALPIMLFWCWISTIESLSPQLASLLDSGQLRLLDRSNQYGGMDV